MHSSRSRVAAGMMLARPAPLLLLLALSCAPARGLQPAGLSTAVYVEGLTPDNWHYAFDPTSEWQPRIQVPPRAASVQSIQEHMQVTQESARAIGRQMGVPYMPHDFSSTLGDGSLEGIKARTHERFGEMTSHIPGISGVTDFLLAQVGNGGKVVDPETAFESYSMVANRLGAKSLANQLAPLLRSTTPPNPTSLFNMVGSILAARGMPKESIEFYREMARMFSSSVPPTQEMLHSLQNRTLLLMKNRTMGLPGATPATYEGAPDYYKSTSNAAVVLFQLPCSSKTVCFSLTNEFYSFKSGPGYYGGAYSAGVPGGYAVALGIATRTPWSFISTPFYIYPNTAVGHEYDLKFSQGQYTIPTRQKSVVSAIVKLRESSDCLGTGDGTPGRPRVDTCPLACLVLTGGRPQIYSVLEIEPVRAVGKDALVSFYDVLKFGGPVMGKVDGSMMPDWAWAGFYRQIGGSSKKSHPAAPSHFVNLGR